MAVTGCLKALTVLVRSPAVMVRLISRPEQTRSLVSVAAAVSHSVPASQTAIARQSRSEDGEDEISSYSKSVAHVVNIMQTRSRSLVGTRDSYWFGMQLVTAEQARFEVAVGAMLWKTPSETLQVVSAAHMRSVVVPTRSEQQYEAAHPGPTSQVF